MTDIVRPLLVAAFLVLLSGCSGGSSSPEVAAPDPARPCETNCLVQSDQQPDVDPYAQRLPFGNVDLFLRGSMNEWGESDSFFYWGDGFYYAEVFLEPGEYEFRIATSDWETIELGARDEDSSAAPVYEETEVSASERSLTVTIDRPDTYYFELYANNPDFITLVIHPQDAAPVGPRTMYLRGTMNGWEAVDALTFVGQGVYEIRMTLPPDVYAFKIADGDWDVDFGAVSFDRSMLSAGIPEELSYRGDNLSFEVTEEVSLVFEANFRRWPRQPFEAITVYVEGDFDSDGIPDADDPDQDNDGIIDADDLYPRDPTSGLDTDGDGVPDSSDAFPDDPNEQFDSDGDGIGDNSDPTYDEPPEPGPPGFGNNVLFLRGTMNRFSNDLQFEYDGEGSYWVTTWLDAGQHQFRIATANWEGVDLGATTDDEPLVLREPRILGGEEYIVLNIAEAGGYTFFLDASDSNIPLLHVRTEIPFGDQSVILGGSLSGGTSIELTYQWGGTYSAMVDVTQGVHSILLETSDGVYFRPEDEFGEIYPGFPNRLQVTDSSTEASTFLPVDGTYEIYFDATNIFAPTIRLVQPLPFGDDSVFVRGTFNGWNTYNELFYVGGTFYSAEMDLPAGDHSFRIASADWATFNFGTTGDPAVVLFEPESLGDGGEDMQFSLASASRVRFFVDATDAANPVLFLENATPFGETTPYLRGTMNEWNLDNPLRYYRNNLYITVLTLEPGVYELKIGSEDWAEIDLGSDGETEALLEILYVLIWGGPNLVLSELAEATEAQTLVFEVDAGAPWEPYLTIYPENAFGPEPFFLRGTMNDWGETLPLSDAGELSYTVQVELEPGIYEFKLANSDWEMNLGAAPWEDPFVPLDSPKSLLPYGENLVLEVNTAGTYEFVIEGYKFEDLRLTVRQR